MKNYTEIIVDINGDGFTSIQEASDSITDASNDNWYLVKIKKGVYNEKNLVFARFTDYRGDDPLNTIINGYNPDNTPIGQIQLTSTIHRPGNSSLENLTIQIENGRYAVHAEGNDNVRATHRNCIFIHKGNDGADAYHKKETWDTQDAFGHGFGDNEQIIFEKCLFIAPYRGLATHTNKSDSNSFIKAIDCDFQTTKSKWSVRCGANQDANQYWEFINSRFNAGLMTDGGYHRGQVYLSGCTPTYLLNQYVNVSDRDNNKLVFNTGEKIRKGYSVKYDKDGISLFTETDNPLFYAGIALDDIMPLKWGEIQIGGFIHYRRVKFAKYYIPVYGDVFGISDGGKIKKDVKPTIMICKENNYLSFKT